MGKIPPANKKVLAVLKWYDMEKIKMNDAQRILLLNKWIKSCTGFEEYEMSRALLSEKIKIIRARRYKKRKRTFMQSLVLRFKITFIRNGIRKTIQRAFQRKRS